MQDGSVVNVGIHLGIGAAPGPTGGVLVQTLQRFGSAAKAGVQVGDEVIASNGQTLATFEQWLADLEAIGVGNTVTLRVLRAGAPVEIAMKLLEKKALSLEVKALEQVLERKISP
jgi:S1-C subfamily serine protease